MAVEKDYRDTDAELKLERSGNRTEWKKSIKGDEWPRWTVGSSEKRRRKEGGEGERIY